MTRYLDPQEVADRLGVARRTAMALMMEMNPIPVCGTVRKRYRVTEESLDRWMAKRTIGKPTVSRAGTGCKKRLERR